mgnify:CR=1 FL=1
MYTISTTLIYQILNHFDPGGRIRWDAIGGGAPFGIGTPVGGAEELVGGAPIGAGGTFRTGGGPLGGPIPAAPVGGAFLGGGGLDRGYIRGEYKI